MWTFNSNLYQNDRDESNEKSVKDDKDKIIVRCSTGEIDKSKIYDPRVKK